MRREPWHVMCGTTSSPSGEDSTDTEDVEDNDERESGASRTIVEGIEDAVRFVGLGDENYRFGDLGRRAVSDFKSQTEDAVRAATGDEEYNFGDRTKQAVSDLTKTTEDTVRTVTKNEEFKMGYYARVLKKKQDMVMSEFIGDLLGDYNVPLVENLSPSQRRSLIHAAIQMLALGCLCLNFVMNIFSGVTIFLAWASALSKTGMSPLASAASWNAFLSAHSALRIFSGPAVMPVQCVAALFLSPWYRKCLLWLQMRLAARRESEKKK